MGDTVLFAAAETLVARELGVDTVACSGDEPCFLYDDSYVLVKPSEYADGQEPPYFDIQQTALDYPTDVYVFSVKKGSDWDFYIVKTSAVNSCADGQSCISLSLIEPISLHAHVGGVKQAVALACSV